jgi:hypothetical protein
VIIILATIKGTRFEGLDASCGMRDELGFASEIPGHTSLATKAARQPDSHHSHPTHGVSHLRLPDTGYVSIITPLKPGPWMWTTEDLCSPPISLAQRQEQKIFRRIRKRLTEKSSSRERPPRHIAGCYVQYEYYVSELPQGRRFGGVVLTVLESESHRRKKIFVLKSLVSLTL